MSELDKAVQTLNAQWYNAVVSALRLSPDQFQLFQGNSPLANTSETLWQVYDAIPPQSVDSFYNPSQANSFSTDYANVLTVMNSKGLSNLQSVLGDSYMDFMNAWKASTSTDMLTFFKTWCSKNVPDKCEAGERSILAAQNDPVVVALTMWTNAGGLGGKAKAYDVTVDMIQSKLAGTPGGTATMDSATSSSDVSSTWAKASVGGFYDIFHGDASGKYNSLAQTFTSSSVRVKATFQNALTQAAGPMSQKNSTDPTLSKYEPWYVSSVLGDAYATKDNTVWQTGKTPNWESTFGAQGNMPRQATAVVVVDGIDITVTSAASFSQSDSKSFEAAASGGFWPFFQASASGGWSSSTSLNDSGQITVTSKSPAGNPQVLGILQTPAPDYITG